MEVDVALLILLAAAFLLGVLRGAVRQLIVIGAWLVTFVVAAYLRPTVGDWIASNAPEYSRAHVEMLAFAASFLAMHDSLIPGLMALLGPVLPLDIRAGYP